MAFWEVALNRDCAVRDTARTEGALAKLAPGPTRTSLV